MCKKWSENDKKTIWGISSTSSMKPNTCCTVILYYCHVIENTSKILKSIHFILEYKMFTLLYALEGMGRIQSFVTLPTQS